jgi:hypothetical protein
MNLLRYSLIAADGEFHWKDENCCPRGCYVGELIESPSGLERLWDWRELGADWHSRESAYCYTHRLFLGLFLLCYICSSLC